MNVCVFGASSSKIDKKYITAVEELCEKLAQRGHSLVFGAGKNGLMGAAARGFTKGGGHITGVIPEFFKEKMIEAIYNECDELIYTESMRERKAVMEDIADVFIITPGGVGTYEEFFEVLTLKQLGRHTKTIAIFNIDKYYDSMKTMMDEATDKKFINSNCDLLYKFIDDADSLIEYIESDTTIGLDVTQLKDG